MATLTASENPVGVWGGNHIIHIEWDADGNAAGLYLTDIQGATIIRNEVLIDGDPDAGTSSGGIGLNVEVGHTYYLSVRQDVATIFATLIVTVIDLEARAIAQAAAAASLTHKLNPPQMIYNLSIKAGIDSGRIRFKTVQPTIPLVRAIAPDGKEVGSVVPLLGGLRTDHDVLLGQGLALPQNSEITVKITASGKDPLGRIRETIATSHFTTGTRNARIDFEQIVVRKDGDPAGEGEFTFRFNAGDTDDPAGPDWEEAQYRTNVSDDDPPVTIRERIDIRRATRTLWIGARGLDDDWGDELVVAPDGPDPGTGWASDDYMD